MQQVLSGDKDSILHFVVNCKGFIIYLGILTQDCESPYNGSNNNHQPIKEVRKLTALFFFCFILITETC